ncbi:hypothetical protein ACWEQC_22025 [Streptomyces shenzhenensis]
MSAITFEDLVQLAARTQPADVSEVCGTCGAAADATCTLDCDNRGAAAVDEVTNQIADLPCAEFEKILRSAREREARDDETPGFFWAWLAVDTEAEARGMVNPVGI